MKYFKHKLIATCYLVEYETYLVSDTEIKIKFTVHENPDTINERKIYKFNTICNHTNNQLHKLLKIENLDDTDLKDYDIIPVQFSIAIIEYYPNTPPSGCGHEING